VPALLLLGAPWKRWQQAAVIAGLVALTYSLNALMTPAHTAPEWRAVGFGRIRENLQAIIGTSTNCVWPSHVVFANAGGLVLLLWCLFRRRDWPLRLVGLAYFIGEFCGGRFSEFRIWFEVLPLGWILVSDLRTETA